MAIPADVDIERELLSLLANSPDGRLAASECYEKLALLFPEVTLQERTLKFRNSVSQWANRVQFCRQHLVDKEYVYGAQEGPNHKHGVWIITSTGRDYVSGLNTQT